MSQSRKDDPKYDAMSTEALEDLLRTDFESNDSSSDMDAILAGMKEIAKRKKHSGEYPAAEQSWDTFCKKYLSDDNVSSHDIDRKNTTGYSNIHKPLKKKRRKTRFFAGAVAAMLIIVCSSTLHAQGFGHNLWDVFIQWTSETFAFGQESTDQQMPENSQTYDSLQEALKAHGIKEKIVPTKIPSTYSLISVDVTESETVTNFAAFYQSENDEEYLLITVNHIQDYTYSTFEKDDTPVETWKVDGITHYFFSNLDSNTVAWMNGKNECAISSSLSKKELKTMIESIYER